MEVDYIYISTSPKDMLTTESARVSHPDRVEFSHAESADTLTVKSFLELHTEHALQWSMDMHTSNYFPG